MGEFINFLGNNLADFWTYTGFANATVGHIVMILIGLFFIYLAVAKEFEPMLLIPIGFGILIGNIPFNMEAGLKVGERRHWIADIQNIFNAYQKDFDRHATRDSGYIYGPGMPRTYFAGVKISI